MIILALDSTCQTGAVSLSDDDRLIAEYTLNTKNTHSETLLPMIESVLSFSKIKPSDIELFAVASGPGSFTGVRIGVATIKGLAFGTDTPCVGVSTLCALAYNLEIAEGIICPVMNARRNQVYTAVFRCDSGKLTRLMPDSVMRIEELCRRLEEFNEPVYFCGDGYSLLADADKRINTKPTPERICHNSAFSAAKAALEMYRGGEFTTAEALTVTYLRPSQAERERQEKIKAKEEKI